MKRSLYAATAILYPDPSMEHHDMDFQCPTQHSTLRYEQLFVFVTSKDFIGVGARLDTGAISPRVNRQTREICP